MEYATDFPVRFEPRAALVGWAVAIAPWAPATNVAA